MDLYYIINENGYWIFDHNNELFRIHQYEPYIPYPELGYEGSAQKQIEDLMTPPPPYDPMDDPQYAAGYEQALLDMLEEEAEV